MFISTVIGEEKRVILLPLESTNLIVVAAVGANTSVDVASCKPAGNNSATDNESSPESSESIAVTWNVTLPPETALPSSSCNSTPAGMLTLEAPVVATEFTSISFSTTPPVTAAVCSVTVIPLAVADIKLNAKVFSSAALLILNTIVSDRKPFASTKIVTSEIAVNWSKPNANEPSAEVNSLMRVKASSNKRGSVVAAPSLKNVKVAPGIAAPVVKSTTLPDTSTSIIGAAGGGNTTSGKLGASTPPKQPDSPIVAATTNAS